MGAEAHACPQMLRRRWLALIHDAQRAAADEAEVRALKAEAAVQAAPFAAAALVQSAQVDADWAAILDALRKRRREMKAARQHVAKVEAARPEAAHRAAELLQAAWHMQEARRMVQQMRREKLLRAARLSPMRLRGGGRGSDRVSDDAASGQRAGHGGGNGKGRRTGATLKLAAPDGEAAQLLPELASRRNALAGKSKWRDMQRIHGELPVAAVDVSRMPRRPSYQEGTAGDAKFNEDYQKWHDKALRARVMQQRCAAQYEKKVGLVNYWLAQQGHAPFAEWVQGSVGRDGACSYSLVLIVKRGKPQVPSVEAICEWAFCYATGAAKKGGSREYRNGPWYGTVGGEKQGDRLMPEGKERAFGYGAYANEAPRFTTIEQTMSALRQWMVRALKDYPGVANPMYSERLKEAMAALEGQTARAVVEARLPRTLTEEEVQRMIRTARVTTKAAGSVEEALREAQDLFNVTKNLVHGTRAHDEYLLDWSDVAEMDAAGGGTGGLNFQHVASKTNKKQCTRKKGLMCSSACPGELALTKDGMIDAPRFCVVHLGLHVRELQSQVLGVDVATLVSLDVPVYCEVLKIVSLRAGSTLVCAESNSAHGDAQALVCCVTRAEHCEGYVYNRTVPFVVNGKEHWPLERGTWFEVPGTRCALRAWADANGETCRLKQQLLRAGKREGVDVDVSKVTSKTLRRTMATVLSKKVSMAELVALGEWSSEAMARRYKKRGKKNKRIWDLREKRHKGVEKGDKAFLESLYY